jgi:type II secretory pathway pseudopilin PulG
MMKNKRQLGMSMIEVMVVLLVTTIITGAVFSQIVHVQQRAASEQVKLDIFQESRDFMDQLSRDLHQAGYPSPKNLAAGQVTSVNSSIAAVGLVKVDANELRFEGDVDGTGTVKSLVYQLVATGTNCPCLRRSQIDKITGDPLTGQGTPEWYTEVQNVQNGATPIFYAYTGGGNPVTLPLAITGDPSTAANPTQATADNQTLASIDTIKIVLTTQAKYPDPQTGVKPSATLVSTIRLNNCSQAASGMPMSCQ